MITIAEVAILSLGGNVTEAISLMACNAPLLSASTHQAQRADGEE